MLETKALQTKLKDELPSGMRTARNRHPTRFLDAAVTARLADIHDNSKT